MMPPAGPAARTTTIDLVYFNAGGGHRASALALQAEIRRQGRPWQVRLVNLREVIDPNDGFRKLTGIDPEDIYNRRLANGWAMGLSQELKLLQGLIRWAHPKLVRTLQQHWLATEPDLVVADTELQPCTVPVAGDRTAWRALCHAVDRPWRRRWGGSCRRCRAGAFR
jgi:hypothetical protein